MSDIPQAPTVTSIPPPSESLRITAPGLLAYGHRCMSTPVVAFRDGKTYQREDGASVIFVKIP